MVSLAPLPYSRRSRGHRRLPCLPSHPPAASPVTQGRSANGMWPRPRLGRTHRDAWTSSQLSSSPRPWPHLRWRPVPACPTASPAESLAKPTPNSVPDPPTGPAPNPQPNSEPSYPPCPHTHPSLRPPSRPVPRPHRVPSRPSRRGGRHPLATTRKSVKGRGY